MQDLIRHERSSHGQKAMQVVILAGGLATRLRPVTARVPKSMLEIAGRPFLQHQIELLRRYGVRDIVLCIGHMGDQIEQYFGDGGWLGVRIRYSREGEQLLGTAGALKLAEPLLEDAFLVMYGDSYLLLDYADVMQSFRGNGPSAVMVVYRNANRFDRSNVVVEDGLVVVYDKHNRKPEMEYIDYGLLALPKSVLSMIPPDEPAALDTHLLGPLATQHQLAAYQANQRFYEIGSFQGLTEFKRLMEKDTLAA